MNKPKKPQPESRRRRTFSDDFKYEAVALAKSIGVRQAASDLNISEGNLRNWKKAVEQHGDLAFAGVSEHESASHELRRLRSENRILKQERDILKKAAAYFAKENA